MANDIAASNRRVTFIRAELGKVERREVPMHSVEITTFARELLLRHDQDQELLTAIRDEARRATEDAIAGGEEQLRGSLERIIGMVRAAQLR